jgi:transcriptional regulator with XRE-family HTH domain
VSPALPDLHARIVAALRAARQEARLRQVDLAKRLGWQQAYVAVRDRRAHAGGR